MSPIETVQYIEARRAALEAELSAATGLVIHCEAKVVGSNPAAATLPLAHAAAVAGGHTNYFPAWQSSPAFVCTSYPRQFGRTALFHTIESAA